MSTQPLFPTFEPSEQDLVYRALAQPLEKKIARAIALLQHWEPEALKLDPRGYWVADSFGKDSDCIVELAKMAQVKHHCEHNLTTIDPPELIWYGKQTRPETHINRPKTHLLHRMVEKTVGPPTRAIRWCCAEYKERASSGIAGVVGVRIQESANRAATWKEFVRVKGNMGNGYTLAVIAYWTTADVWEFHKLRNIPHCKLYDEGFERLGCVGCPLAKKTSQDKEFLRWPRYEKMWRDAFDKFWLNHANHKRMDGKEYAWKKFGSAEKHWNWWRTGEGQGDGPNCQGAELFALRDLEEGTDHD